MVNLIFVCHGNICRSVCAQYLFTYLINKKHLQHKYSCFSRALTTEEIGNDIYPPMKEVMDKYHIPYSIHEASLLSKTDVDSADMILYMDNENKWLIDNYYPYIKKPICLASFINKKEITDPWYHRDFDGCFKQIELAINKLIDYLENN